MSGNLNFGPKIPKKNEILKFSLFLFWAVILVPELFRKLRETPGNNFHLVSSNSKPGCLMLTVPVLTVLVLPVLVLTVLVLTVLALAHPNEN